MSDFEQDVDMESDADTLGNGKGLDSDSESGASSSESSSESSSSSDSSSSSSSDGEYEDVPVPVVIMLPEEKELAEELTNLSLVEDTEDNIASKVQDVWNPLVRIMTAVLRLQELSPLADFKNHVRMGVEIAQAQPQLSRPGDLEVGCADLPHDVLIHRVKLQVSKWKRRANVEMIKDSVRNTRKKLKISLAACELRSRGRMASRDLEWVLRRRAAGDLEDTALGSEDAVVEFAVDAWTIMNPQDSELEGTLLEGGVTSEKLGRWLRQEDVLESLFRWRRLRRAGSELTDDADMVKKVQAVFEQPKPIAADVEVSVPVAKVSMLRRKRT
jgi:hypothetical protein